MGIVAESVANSRRKGERKMGRAIAAVVVGYLVMAVLVFATFSIAYFAMGADRAFHPGTYDMSLLWLATGFLLSVLAATAGGLTCAAIAPGGQAPLVLAVLVFVLGMGLAVPTILAKPDDKPKARGGDVSNFEAMQQAREPLWVALANPFIGAGGALLGSRLKARQAA